MKKSQRSTLLAVICNYKIKGEQSAMMGQKIFCSELIFRLSGIYEMSVILQDYELCQASTEAIASIRYILNERS